MSSTVKKELPFKREEPYPFDYNKELKTKPFVFKGLMPLAHFLLGKEFESVEFYGAENVPQDGPFLMIANHVNGFDPITLVTGFEGRRSCYFMAKEEFYQAFYTYWCMEIFNCFPVKTNTADRESIKFAKRVAADGRFGLVIFPQGTRDRYRKRPELESAKNGYAMLARDCKIPVVPCSIHLEPDTNKKHPKCIVRYGKLIPYEDLGFTEGSRKKKELNAAAELMWKKVQELWDMDEM